MEGGNLKSIRQSFSVWFISVIVLIVFTFSFFLIQYNSKKAKKSLSTQLANISSTAKISLTTALWQYNHAYIEDYIDSLFLNGDLVLVSVSSENKVIKTKKRSEFKDKDLSFFQSSPLFIINETPIHFKDLYIGKITAVMSYKRINKVTSNNSHMAILFLCLIIFAIIVTNYMLLQKYVFNPVKKLKASAQKIADGDLDAVIDIKSKDEIGDLAATFGQMMENIKAITTSRDNLNQEVKRRKKAQEAFEEANERFLQLANHTDDIFWLFDISNRNNIRILYLNPAFESIWKIKLIDAYNNPGILLTSIHPDDRETICDHLQPIIENKKGVHAAFRIILPDQSIRNIRARGNPIFNKRGKLTRIAGIAQDVTDHYKAKREKEKLELQLQQAHKMEAIGTLAGGIAHDFNNILGIILGNAELAIDDIPKDNPARLSFQEIIIASQRAKDVIWQLLSFSRKNVKKKEAVDIISIVLESLTLLRSSIPRTIEIIQDLPEKALFIMADATQIHQIIINLCTNAAYAMDKNGGKLTVSVESITPDHAKLSDYTGYASSEYIKLSVTDTGDGVDASILDRIFEPYFTTKPVGKGSGMGLAVVHGIIKYHGGDISVESTVGKGTCVEIIFPTIFDAINEQPLKQSQLPKGKETILFVDDEASLLRLGKKMLEQIGYSVKAMDDPVEAVKIFKNDPDKYDLIITDMTMPKMTGDGLIKSMLSIQPNIPIILCTGFSEKISREEALKLGAKAYIEKPVNSQTLAVTIREILDSPF